VLGTGGCQPLAFYERAKCMAVRGARWSSASARRTREARCLRDEAITTRASSSAGKLAVYDEAHASSSAFSTAGMSSTRVEVDAVSSSETVFVDATSEGKSSSTTGVVATEAGSERTHERMRLITRLGGASSEEATLDEDAWGREGREGARMAEEGGDDDTGAGRALETNVDGPAGRRTLCLLKSSGRVKPSSPRRLAR
jgi:hypothetical protein